jgi:hypothetical protein
MFNLPAPPLICATERQFRALAQCQDSNSSKGQKVLHPADVPRKMLPILDVCAPLLPSEILALESLKRSTGGLKRVRTINKVAGKEMKRKRRKQKENLTIAFFANGFWKGWWPVDSTESSGDDDRSSTLGLANPALVVCSELRGENFKKKRQKIKTQIKRHKSITKNISSLHDLARRDPWTSFDQC